MQSEPIAINGVLGQVAVSTNQVTGRHDVTVDGQPAQRTKGSTFSLPSTDGGTVEARVKSSFINPFPTLEVGGVKYPTGPALPLWMQVLMVLPIGLVFVGGLIGGLIGAIGVAGNSFIARGSQSTAIKAVLMLGVLVLAALVWLVVVGLVSSTVAS